MVYPKIYDTATLAGILWDLAMMETPTRGNPTPQAPMASDSRAPENDEEEVFKAVIVDYKAPEDDEEEVIEVVTADSRAPEDDEEEVIEVVTADSRAPEDDEEEIEEHDDLFKYLNEQILVQADVPSYETSIYTRHSTMLFPTEAQDPDTLTMGVEFEFMIPIEELDLSERPSRYFVSWYEQSHNTETPVQLAQKFIAKTLTNAGIPAKIMTDEAFPGEIHESYKSWVVTQDASLDNSGLLDTSDESNSDNSNPSKGKGKQVYRLVDDFNLIGIEVNSRILPANERGYAELTKALTTLRATTLMHINAKCGLHIHIDASTLSLDAKMFLVSLYACAEDALHLLCAPHRLDVQYAAPVGTDSRYAGAARDACAAAGKPYAAALSWELHEEMARTRATRDMRASLLQDERISRVVERCALAMKHVGPAVGEEDDEAFPFEFRHMQGSVDAELVRQWARVCVALVTLAKGFDADAPPRRACFALMIKFCGIASQYDGEAWVSLLRVLGLEDPVAFWRARKLAYQVPGGWMQMENGADGFAMAL